jgi:hypothetical protein
VSEGKHPHPGKACCFQSAGPSLPGVYACHYGDCHAVLIEPDGRAREECCVGGFLRPEDRALRTLQGLSVVALGKFGLAATVTRTR